MRMFPTLAVLGLTLTLTLGAAGPARADLYLGAGLGAVRYDIGLADWDADAGRIDDSDRGLKVFAGYDVNRFFAVETALVDLGKTTFSDGSDSGRDEPRSWSVTGIARYPLSPAWSLHGRIGVHAWRSRVVTRTGGERTRTSESEQDLLLGAGVMLQPWRRFGLVAEWERYTEIVGTDVDFYSVSGRVTF